MNADDLTAVKRLYVDTAPFIYFTEARQGYGEKMYEIINIAVVNRIQLVTAAITLTEVLVKPLQNNDAALVEQYRRLFYRTKNLLVVPITAAISESAARLRARYALRTPDALHAASAIQTQCDALLANDSVFQRLQELLIILLDDWNA